MIDFFTKSIQKRKPPRIFKKYIYFRSACERDCDCKKTPYIAQIRMNQEIDTRIKNLGRLQGYTIVGVQNARLSKKGEPF